eukprot:1448235-Pleurochrysis_carterae.AAC.2
MRNWTPGNGGPTELGLLSAYVGQTLTRGPKRAARRAAAACGSAAPAERTSRSDGHGCVALAERCEAGKVEAESVGEQAGKEV